MEITSVPHIMIMYPYRVFTKFRFTMISYTATCMATAGSSVAKVNALRIRPLPGNLKRFSTYASCVPMIMDTASTTTRTIRELRNATSIFAFVNAFTKLSKFSQLCGRVITLVDLYSASVLKAVITQETIGSTAMKAKNIRDAYLMMVQITNPGLYCFLLL